MSTRKDDAVHDTQITSLFNKVNTPRNKSYIDCPKFSNKPQSLNELETVLGNGGYGTAYLYYSENSKSYRVIKRFFNSQQDSYGGIQRRVREFNNLYGKIHQGKFSSLATAEIITIEEKNLLDMPYIEGEYIQLEQSEQVTEVVTENRDQLFDMFKEYGFFLVDYDGQGNIVAFNENGSQFLLIRDIDELGLRDSFSKSPEHSITSKLLNKVKEDRKDEIQDFQSILSQQKKKPISSNTLPSYEQGIKTLVNTILPKMKNEEKRLAMSKALTMQEVCYIACQNRGSIKQTHTMDLIRDFLKKPENQFLNIAYNIKDKKINVQLRSIGLCGKNLHSEYFSKQTRTLGGISFWKTSEDMRNELRKAFSHENKNDLSSYKEKLAKITQPQTAKIEDNSFTMKK